MEESKELVQVTLLVLVLWVCRMTLSGTERSSQLWNTKWMLQYFPSNVHLTVATTCVTVECSPQMLPTGTFAIEYRAIPFAEQISGVYCNTANKERSKVGLQCAKRWVAGCSRAGESASPPGSDCWMLRHSPDHMGLCPSFHLPANPLPTARSRLQVPHCSQTCKGALSFQELLHNGNAGFFFVVFIKTSSPLDYKR